MQPRMQPGCGRQDLGMGDGQACARDFLPADVEQDEARRARGVDATIELRSLHGARAPLASVYAHPRA
eukprot:741337-Pyramimonas_sp.AAC.1